MLLSRLFLLNYWEILFNVNLKKQGLQTRIFIATTNAILRYILLENMLNIKY